MEEENYDKIISECTKEIEAKGKYMAEALLLRATFYLLIGNANAANPDLNQVIVMEDANVKVSVFRFTKPFLVVIVTFKKRSDCGVLLLSPALCHVVFRGNQSFRTNVKFAKNSPLSRRNVLRTTLIILGKQLRIFYGGLKNILRFL